MLRIHDRIYIYVLDIYSLLSSRLLFFCLYCKFSLSPIFVYFHVYVYICVLLSCIGGNKDYLLTYLLTYFGIFEGTQLYAANFIE